MLWRLKRLAKQRSVIATVVMLLGIVLVGLAQQFVVGTILVAASAYVLILPEFIEPHDPTA